MEEKPNNSEYIYPSGLPCPICGGQSYTWGKMGGSRLTNVFVSDEVGFLARLFGMGGKRVYARECDRCHNVQLFTQE